jgi:phage-related protein
MEWKVQFLNQAVRAELVALPDELQAGLAQVIDLIERFGPQNISLPHARPLERGLWEMRFRGPQGIGRAIYCQPPGGRVVVLHVFMKKTRETPRRAIELARRRMKEIR